MPLSFLTISLSQEEYYRKPLKIFLKKYEDSIQFLVKEFGDKERHLHFHALVELPAGIIKNKSKLAKELNISEIYGLKIVKVLDSKMELWYAGYLQKEIKKALPIDIFKERVFKCIYGSGYLAKAYQYYLDNLKKNKPSAKDSFDGTLLAQKIRAEYNYKGYDQALYCVFQYSLEYKVDIRRPDTIAQMMQQMDRMEKLKKLPVKKNIDLII